MTNGVRLQVEFFKTEAGNEPVREWIKSLPRHEQKTIGADIKVVQFGWPVGMPLVRKLETDLWEGRSTLGNRIARVLFTVDSGIMTLLHGFIKQSQKTPAEDLALARKRLRQWRS
jgi:phage-related protein